MPLYSTMALTFKPEKPAPSVEELQQQIFHLRELVNRSQAKWIRLNKVFFLDFDGPLAIPWTVDENHWGHIPELIPRLAQKGTLCLISFNPGAEDALIRWGLRHHFKACRSGTNFPRPQGAYQEEWRHGLSKAKQITSILENELQGIKDYDCAIFDDDAKNLNHVHAELNIRCYYVDSDQGLEMKILEL